MEGIYLGTKARGLAETAYTATSGEASNATANLSLVGSHAMWRIFPKLFVVRKTLLDIRFKFSFFAT